MKIFMPESIYSMISVYIMYMYVIKFAAIKVALQDSFVTSHFKKCEAILCLNSSTS